MKLLIIIEDKIPDSISSKQSKPSTTSPKTTCRLSNELYGANNIKN